MVSVTQAQPEKPKSRFGRGVAIVLAVCLFVAIVWRLILPWTTPTTDLAFAVICAIGALIAAAHKAKR